MAFTKETPILYFSPSSFEPWNKRQDLLLPAWCYRVIAPQIQRRKINILEKAVLGMCRIGISSAVDIGETLDIGTDLAALIITELTDNGFIDKHGLLSDRGLKILEEENLDNQDLLAGFVFQDPWTAELFPRFIERQEYIDVKFSKSGYPEINLGTTGKPNYRRAYMPFPVDNYLKVQPSPQDIFQAVIKHKKALSYRKFSEDLAEDEWTFDQVPNLHRISFIEEEPTPVWLATFIYLAKDSFSTASWNICDPFGLGNSPWLRRKLESQIKKNPSLNGLNKLIADLIDVNNISSEIGNGFNDFIKLAEEEAILNVEKYLTLEIHRWDSIFNYLVSMEMSHIEATLSSKSPRVKDRLDDVLIKAQKVLETVLLFIREKHPTNNSWQALSSNDREYKRNLLNGLANKLGFTTPLPNTLVDVKPGKIRASCDSGVGSLRSHLIAAMLTARYDNKHPLYLLAQKSPDILIRLDKLAEIRDQSSHASNQQLETEEVLLQISTVYDFVAGMLDINANNQIASAI
ncbi:hypothetical protein H6G36_00845 [Anabaena minutissima FACHB-250]|nr:hypothetical protein [Anabaena minutissima FACHB-250]